MRPLLATLLLSCFAVMAIHAKPVEFAIAIHGGAGSNPKDPAKRKARLDGIHEALTLGRDMLAAGKTSIDTVEAVVRMLEDNPTFNAGRGAVLNAKGIAQCDASIMRGSDLACGASAASEITKNPIALARKVMTETPHVLLCGKGADQFAKSQGLEIVDAAYFRTQPAKNPKPGTVGCVALDKNGDLAAATSTGGLQNKMPGRVGDSPIIGAGTYADNRTCAVSSTGVGEEFIRRVAAYDVSAQMAYRQASLDDAMKNVIFTKMKPGFGGMIAVDKDGNISMQFSTAGMARAAADSGGRFEIGLGPKLEK